MSAPFMVRQEPDALAKRKVVAISAGGVLVFGAALLVAWLLLGALREGRVIGAGAPALAPTTIGILEQRLILASPRGLEAHASRRASLEGWGWVDRDAGIARIPVERAMDLVVGGGGAPP